MPRLKVDRPRAFGWRPRAFQLILKSYSYRTVLICFCFFATTKLRRPHVLCKRDEINPTTVRLISIKLKFHSVAIRPRHLARTPHPGILLPWKYKDIHCVWERYDKDNLHYKTVNIILSSENINRWDVDVFGHLIV